MLEVTLGEKKYSVPYVSALALREIARPMEIIRRTEEEEASPRQYERDLDTLVSWFCVLFGNQFSPGEVYEQYPVDRLLHDITLAALAVNSRVSAALSAFPTRAAAAPTSGTPE